MTLTDEVRHKLEKTLDEINVALLGSSLVSQSTLGSLDQRVQVLNKKDFG
jgi:hypothetical protein